MKTFTLIFALVITCATALAQQGIRSVKPRLIATTNSTGSGVTHVINDSSVFRYSPTNDSSFSVEDIYDYNTTTMLYDSTELALESYNSKGLNDTTTVLNWDTLTKSYVGNYRIDELYDASGNDTLSYLEEWNTVTLKWYYVSKTVYLFQGNNDTAFYSYSYDTTTKKFIPGSGFAFSFDSHNNITLESTIGWSGSNWVYTPFWEYMNTYNTNGQDSTSMELSYNGTKWDTSFLFTYIYYKSNNYDSMELVYQWSNSHSWENDEKYTYIYNGSGKRINYLTQTYDLNTNKWNNYQQNVNTYNSYGEVVADSGYTWSNGTGHWVVTFCDINYYQLVTTAAAQVLSDNQLSVYPNPSTSYLHVNIALGQPVNLRLRLVNALGETVWSNYTGNTGNLNYNIPVANLESGIYLLQMQTPAGTQTKTVMVAR